MGRWSGPGISHPDPRLQDLHNQLPNYCLKARADTTRKKYRYAFEKFSKWCSSYNPVLDCLPSKENTVSMYIVYLAQTFQSVSKIQEAAFAISWIHNLAGFLDPCTSSLFKQVKEGAIRDCAKPIVKKEPISASHLASLVNTLGKENCTLFDLRTVTMCLLGYAGFFRFSEISSIRMQDIVFQDDHVSILIPHSKTDKLRQGSHVKIANTQNSTCPVRMLSRYLKQAAIPPGSNEYIFRQLTYMKKTNTYKLRSNDKPISYTRTREFILTAFESIGLKKSSFGLHSLRSGGASAAAAAGVSDRLFKKHGRWKSETAKDGYVHENIEEVLSISKKLGI